MSSCRPMRNISIIWFTVGPHLATHSTCNVSGVVSMCGIPVAPVKDAYCIIVFAGKTPEETNESNIILNLRRRKLQERMSKT